MAKKTITLEKTEKGKILQWSVEIWGNTATYYWGQIGGKQQTNKVVFTDGKNIGRANETTPEEQCLFEAEVKARRKIENGYILKEGWLETVSSTVQESNLDIPMPMLASKYMEHKIKVDSQPFIYVQPKLNGNRCLLNRWDGKLYSRKRKEIKHLHPLGIEISLYIQDLDDSIDWLDGELFAHGMSFNKLQSVIRSAKNCTPDMIKSMSFYCFDVVMPLPFAKRLKYLKNLEDLFLERMYVVKTIETKPINIQYYHNRYVKEEGYEGVIIRLPNSIYEGKRSLGLFKYKMFQDEEFKVIGFNPEKHDPNKLGTAICIMNNGETFNVTPKMSDIEKAEIWDNKEEYIGMMATVSFQSYDEVTGIPLFGVLKCFRDDI